MDRLDRLFNLHRILVNRRTAISRQDIEGRLDCSPATVKRLIEDLRDHFNLPVRYDRGQKGYLLDPAEGEAFELPGLWFNPSEIFALMTTYHLLSQVRPGILEPYIAPLRTRLEELLKHRRAGGREIFKRMRILPMAPRATDIEIFRKVTDALVSRHQLNILYHGRERDELSERWISPQRVIYYRDNWYLDAWCHWRKGLRIFSLDRIHVIETGERALDVPEKEMDTHFTPAYGIFAGEARHRAVIRFSSDVSRWVADEQWHPLQTEKPLPDGGRELTIPYSDPRELLMDILKYGPEAEVIEPPELRRLVADKLSGALKKYKKSKKVSRKVRI